MYKSIRLIFCLLLINTLVIGQSSEKWTVGFEQDALPYIFHGYFANAWIGKGHVRSRVLLAKVRKPDFLISEPFTNNHVTAIAVTADYFLKEDWKGWWISGGLVYWKNTIQSNTKIETGKFNMYLLNGSLGYSWKFYKHFYISPWAGLHFKIGGTKSVIVDGETYKPAFINPEASIKIGWHL